MPAVSASCWIAAPPEEARRDLESALDLAEEIQDVAPGAVFAWSTRPDRGGTWLALRVSFEPRCSALTAGLNGAVIARLIREVLEDELAERVMHSGGLFRAA